MSRARALREAAAKSNGPSSVIANVIAVPLRVFLYCPTEALLIN